MRISFFPQQRYRRFQYRPRFYRSIREEQEERLRRLGMEPGNDRVTGKHQVTGMLSEKPKSRSASARNRAANLRLVILILVLLLITYFLYVKK
jgi:hypothetical protein